MPSRLPYPRLAPQGVAAQSAVEHYLNTATALSAVLLELVRLRCSQLNGCDYCIGLHTHELRKHNEPETRIDAVHHWHESDAFTATERAALRWAEVVTDVQQGHVADAEYAAVCEHFRDRDLVDLTLAIGSINAFNRLAITFRPEWHGDRPQSAEGVPHQPQADAQEEPPPGEHSAVGDDGGKVSVDE